MTELQSARRVTIKDVALRVGVSTATVSKVLRNADKVSDRTRQSVRAAMEELGYRPHAAARGMRGRTYTIGVVADDIRNPFLADVLDGTLAALAGTDYSLVIGPGGWSGPGQRRMADALVDRRVDGLILFATTIPRGEAEQLGRQVPTVVVGHHDRSAHFDSVVDDDAFGAALVVDHLVALGHRRIVHTSSARVDRTQWELPPERVRARGYVRAMQRHGLADEIDMVATGYDHVGGYVAVQELLARPRRPTAVFAGADVAAIGALQALDEAGLRVPRDVSLAGYDDSSLASIPAIALTSVDQKGGAMGAEVARLLLERLDGRTSPVHLSSTPSLVVRTSTAPPAEPRSA